jgi:type IX secretion system PorP/SprF family membrane protein
MRKFLSLILVLLVTVSKIQAQVDPHFTQYYAYPVWLNPALTGAIDGEWRITGNYRKQLPAALDPYTTQGLTMDIALPSGFGVGLTLLNQTAVSSSYQYTSGYFSLSYLAQLSEYKMLSAGFQLGMLNRRIDPNKFQFGNQFNPVIGYDPSLPNNEIFAYRSASSVDGGVGLMYFDADPSKKYNPFIGVSLFHPTQPVNRFLSGSDDSKIPMRYLIHGGVRLQLSEKADLIPHAAYIRQGKADETIAGFTLNLKLEKEKELILGSVYRLNDAVAPSLGLRFGSLMVGLSYDISVSQYKTVASSNSGYELSVSFVHKKKTKDTRFIWSRL